MPQTATSTIDPDDIERFSRIADEWWDVSGKFKPLHQMNPTRIGYVREQLVQHLPECAEEAQSVTPLKGLKLLDMGCGGGLISEPLARLGAEMTGIDASEKNIKVAALHAEQAGLSIHYQVDSAESHVQTDARYDAVIALEIVEHVADVPLFLASCAALVKPGGVLIISTLNRTMKSFLMAKIGAEYVLRWLPRGTHQWRQFLLPSEIEAGLSTHEMKLHDLSGMVFNPLRQSWSLSATDLDVNYLMTFQKDAKSQNPVR